jgi:hypothetical protein
MAQVNLPQSIDPNTPMSANEVQSMFVALRDTINGDLEGGSGNNLKANGVTFRELQDAMLSIVTGYPMQENEGVRLGTDGVVTTSGSGLGLDYSAVDAAFITDDSGIVSTGRLIPVGAMGGGSIPAGSVSVSPNASGQPRIDTVVLTLTGIGSATVSVVAGTGTAAATLDNRNGAPALPPDAIRLADILVPNGFAGPFVNATHIRDMRPFTGRPFARVGWTGTVALATNTHASMGAATGLTHLAVDPTVQWDSTGTTLTTAGRMARLAADGRLTAPQTGLYYISASASYAASATAGPRAINLRRNHLTFGPPAAFTGGGIGTVQGEQDGGVGATNSAGVTTSAIWPIQENSEIEATFYQNIGGNLNLTGMSLMMALIAPLPAGN